MDKLYNVNELRSRIDNSVFYGELQSGDKVKLLFNFKDPHSYCDVPMHEFKDLIEDVTAACPCAKDGIFIRDNHIEVLFDTNKATKSTEKIPYETNIVVWWRDGRPMKKINDIGQMVDNQEKTKTYLSIYGSIVPR